jgi:hypothetical protein
MNTSHLFCGCKFNVQRRPPVLPPHSLELTHAVVSDANRRLSETLPLPPTKDGSERPRIDFVVLVADLTSRATYSHFMRLVQSLSPEYFAGHACIVLHQGPANATAVHEDELNGVRQPHPQAPASSSPSAFAARRSAPSIPAPHNGNSASFRLCLQLIMNFWWFAHRKWRASARVKSLHISHSTIYRHSADDS